MYLEEFKQTYQDRLLAVEPPGGSARLQWMKTFSSVFYQTFTIRKPNNRGIRHIQAPIDPLKELQRGMIWEFDQFARSPAAHGLDDNDYIKNALAHKDKAEIFSLDLKDFYQNCTLRRMARNIESFSRFKKIFELAPYIFYATEGLQDPNGCFLTTGSPLSPLIANLAVTDLDFHLQRIADRLKCTYTRYLDDMNFSFDEKLTEGEKKNIYKEITEVITEQSWPINWRKTRWLNPDSDAMVITGVDLRGTPKVTRRYIVNYIRPALNTIARNAFSPYATNHPGFGKITSVFQLIKLHDPKVAGSLAYIKQVNPEQYGEIVKYFCKRLQVAKEKMSFTTPVEEYFQFFQMTLIPRSQGFVEKAQANLKELQSSDLPDTIKWKVAAFGALNN